MSALTSAAEALDQLDSMIEQRVSEVEDLLDTYEPWLDPALDSIQAEIQFYAGIANALQELVDDVLELLLTRPERDYDY